VQRIAQDSASLELGLESTNADISHCLGPRGKHWQLGKRMHGGIII
jgi:hypothetical protein